MCTYQHIKDLTNMWIYFLANVMKLGWARLSLFNRSRHCSNWKIFAAYRFEGILTRQIAPITYSNTLLLEWNQYQQSTVLTYLF